MAEEAGISLHEEGHSIRLPPELLVLIASLSTPASLVKLEQLSKSCRELIREADAICWRHHVLSQMENTTSSSSTLSSFQSSSSSSSMRIDENGLPLSTASFCAMMKERCINKVFWDDLHTWKAIYRRVRKLQANWSSQSKTPPKTEMDIVGFNRVNPLQSALPTPKLRSMNSPRVLDVPYATQDSSYVWRARLDTSRDANFIVMTWHTGGLRVVDATPKYGNGRILWELPNWSVRPYAHLEMSGGIACWDGEDGIEVWKRWKMVLGQEGEDEPPNKRGQFVKVATLSEVDNTRGFMLNELQHLTICSSSGQSVTYDLRPKEGPILLHQYPIPIGAAGHLEHDDKIAVYSMSQKGYAIYEKESGQSLGTLDFSDQASTLHHVMQENKATNFFCVDSEHKYDELASNADRSDTKNGPPRKLFVTVPLERGGLADRSTCGQVEIIEIQPFVRRSPTAPAASASSSRSTPKTHRQNAIDLHQDLWGAAMIRKLQDGSTTLLVARSRGGRVMVCTDLLGLLAALQTSEEAASIKIRQSLSIIECGGRADRTEFYTGGWLAVHNGRAAWEIDEQVYMLELPTRQNTLPQAGTPIWMLPSLYNDEIPVPSLQMPISFMSLHDDAFMSTYLHPSYILISNQGYTRWETTILKSVRIIYFSSSSAVMDDKADEKKEKARGSTAAHEEDEDNIHPLTNANKALHRRWLLTGRRLAQAAEEDREEWTDEEEEGEGSNQED